MNSTRESRPSMAAETAPESVVATHDQATEARANPHPVIPAYCLLVTTPADRETRRLFLSLHAAVRAAARAERRGGRATVQLCRIVPADGVVTDA